MTSELEDLLFLLSLKTDQKMYLCCMFICWDSMLGQSKDVTGVEPTLYFCSRREQVVTVLFFLSQIFFVDRIFRWGTVFVEGRNGRKLVFKF